MSKKIKRFHKCIQWVTKVLETSYLEWRQTIGVLLNQRQFFTFVRFAGRLTEVLNIAYLGTMLILFERSEFLISTCGPPVIALYSKKKIVCLCVCTL